MRVPHGLSWAGLTEQQQGVSCRRVVRLVVTPFPCCCSKLADVFCPFFLAFRVLINEFFADMFVSLGIAIREGFGGNRGKRGVGPGVQRRTPTYAAAVVILKIPWALELSKRRSIFDGLSMHWWRVMNSTKEPGTLNAARLPSARRMKRFTSVAR